LQIKGGQAQFAARLILITSNKPPNQWWKLDNPVFRNAWIQIQRRLTPPIGEVYLASRNEAVEASEDQFNDGFCILTPDPNSILLPDNIMDPVNPNIFRIPRVNADADV
jgi:hypothetical protein